MKKNASEYLLPGRHSGFSLTELLVTIAIIAILTGLLFPAVSSVRRTALRLECTSNLRQVGFTIHRYLEDHNSMPAEGNKGCSEPADSPAWFYRLPPYLDEKHINQPFTIFQCPEFSWSGPQTFTNASPKSYKMNSYLDNDGRPMHYRRARGDGNLVLFLDCDAGETGTGQWGAATHGSVNSDRHGGYCNILLMDGTTLMTQAEPIDGDWSQALPWKSPRWK